MSSTHLENPARHAADRLLMLLKTRGPQTAAELGEALGVTGEAARQQLVRLEAEGLVNCTEEPHGVGRPARVWNLSGNGHARFPDAHAQVTAQLIASIREELGEAALDRLIEARSAETREAYRRELAGASDLADRVARLAAARTREGYMAEWREQDGAFLLIENHCPICVAATACQGFCRTELETFRLALGPGASVERTEHIIDGDRRCLYEIRALD